MLKADTTLPRYGSDLIAKTLHFLTQFVSGWVG
jgi:hypothetical protein